jgi:hypothetical protein
LGFDNNGELSEWLKHSVSSRNKQETAEQMMMGMEGGQQ